MQFHTLFLCIVPLFHFGYQHDITRRDGNVVFVFIEGRIALHNEGITQFQLVDGFFFIGSADDLQGIGAFVIGNVDGIDLPLFVAGSDGFLAGNIAPNGDTTALLSHILQGDRMLLDVLAHDLNGRILDKRQVTAIKGYMLLFRCFLFFFRLVLCFRQRFYEVLQAFFRVFLRFGSFGSVQCNGKAALEFFGDLLTDRIDTARILKEFGATVLQGNEQAVSVHQCFAFIEEAIDRIAFVSNCFENTFHIASIELLRAVFRQ